MGHTSRGGVSTFINMFSRTVLFVTPATTGQVRGMATLRDIQNRLKAVKNIQKITKSMKIVSAAKFNKAERELKAARPYGQGQAAFFESAEVKHDANAPVHLVVACSSDRGLCGGIHSNIMKAIRSAVPEKPAGTELKVIAVGDKQKALMGRLFADKVACHFVEIGKKPPVFQDAAQIAQAILSQDYNFGEADHGLQQEATGRHHLRVVRDHRWCLRARLNIFLSLGLFYIYIVEIEI